MLVTAHLAKPVAPHEAPALPTDTERNDPNDFQLFLLGSDAGGSSKSTTSGGSEAEPAPPRQTAMSNRGPTGELGFIR